MCVVCVLYVICTCMYVNRVVWWWVGGWSGGAALPTAASLCCKMRTPPPPLRAPRVRSPPSAPPRAALRARAPRTLTGTTPARPAAARRRAARRRFRGAGGSAGAPRCLGVCMYRRACLYVYVYSVYRRVCIMCVYRVCVVEVFGGLALSPRHAGVVCSSPLRNPPLLCSQPPPLRRQPPSPFRPAAHRSVRLASTGLSKTPAIFLIATRSFVSRLRAELFGCFVFLHGWVGGWEATVV